jgi:epoxyqueuosine reductase
MLSADLIRERAIELGFDLIGFAPAGPSPGAQSFVDWLAAGHHGEMGYLAREDAVQKRLDPSLVLPGARTVIMVGVSYETLAVPADVLLDPSRGRIARYAWGLDYHDVITPVLREFGKWIAKESRGYVDTGPVLERAWAERCGLGFIGKNTCLIHRNRGSFLFLGAVLVDEVIGDWGSRNAPAREIDRAQSKIENLKSTIGCGACTRCLDACPTNAFPAAGVLDARRCISYLTIELKGEIPIELRPRMGNWIFGCDICQDVCPYVRRFSQPAHSPLSRAFYPIDVDCAAPRLIDVLQLDRAGFNARYKGTPIARARRRGFLRNACVAAANWGDTSTLPALNKLASDEEPLVRSHAIWAISQIKH